MQVLKAQGLGNLSCRDVYLSKNQPVMIVLIIIYFVLSLAVAFMAYLKSFDMIEYFFLCVLTTPIAGFYFLWQTDKLR